MASNALAPTPTNSLAAYMQRQMGFDPNVERLSFLPYPQGALTKGAKIDWTNWVAPQVAYDAAKAYMLPGYAAMGGKYDPEDVANMAMNVAGGGMAIGRAPANSLAMNVYHGTPHRFAATERNPLGEFRASQIGTGEGAQAYGHGLYLAEHPDTAKGYRVALSKDKFITNNGFFDPDELQHLNIRVATRKGDLDKAIEEAKKYAQPNPDYPEAAARASRDLERLKALKASGGIRKNEGSFYHVDLPDLMVEKMLHFDKPLSQQSKYVKDAINKSNYALRDMAYDLFGASDPTGQQIAKASLNPKEFAEHMRSLGVPGIQYLDAGSRGVGGTRNFVVFPGEEKNLTILKRE